MLYKLVFLDKKIINTKYMRNTSHAYSVKFHAFYGIRINYHFTLIIIIYFLNYFVNICDLYF